jgi:hypothetical protein
MKSPQTLEPGVAMAEPTDAEDRKQRRLRRLGTQTPACVGCGETDPTVLELHHIAGRRHDDDQSIVCGNCHKKLTDGQRDRATPPGSVAADAESARLGHYLLGLADLLVTVEAALRKFGARLVAESKPSD